MKDGVKRGSSVRNKVLVFVAVVVLSCFSLFTYGLVVKSSVNEEILKKTYKTPANSYFTDDNFYECIVDTYNSNMPEPVSESGSETEGDSEVEESPYAVVLTDEQLQSITSLNCSGAGKDDSKKISNVVGIDKLSSLTSLSLADNKITSLDLSGNLSLNSLNISNNKLTKLDLSKNINLIDVVLNGNPYSDSLVVYKGGSVQTNSQVVLPSQLAGDVTWTSNNTAVATVDSNGKVTGVSVGTVGIAGNVSDKFVTTSTINVIEIASTRYIINDASSTIFVWGDTDANVIKGNISVPQNVSLDVDLNSNKIRVMHNGQSLREFSILYASTNNNLANLSLNNINISFSKDVLVYNVSTDETSTVISAGAEDGKAKVSGTGTRAIHYGNNQFNIVVTSEAGVSKTYTINVYREDKRSKTNTLKYVRVNGVNYDVNVETHTINVGNLIDKVTVSSGLTDDSTSKYVDGFGNRTVELNEGENQILIKVQAENEVVRTYTFNVVRAIKNAAGQNINISSLVIANHDEFVYTPGMYDFQVVLSEREKRLVLTVVLENPAATYKIENNEELKEDDIVVIKVTSEDKSVTQDYRIKIIREDTYPDEEDDTEDVEEVTEEDNSLLIPIIIFGIGVFMFIIALAYKASKCNKKEDTTDK